MNLTQGKLIASFTGTHYNLSLHVSAPFTLRLLTDGMVTTGQQAFRLTYQSENACAHDPPCFGHGQPITASSTDQSASCSCKCDAGYFGQGCSVPWCLPSARRLSDKEGVIVTHAYSTGAAGLGYRDGSVVQSKASSTSALKRYLTDTHRLVGKPDLQKKSASTSDNEDILLLSYRNLASCQWEITALPDYAPASAREAAASAGIDVVRGVRLHVVTLDMEPKSQDAVTVYGRKCEKDAWRLVNTLSDTASACAGDRDCGGESRGQCLFNDTSDSTRDDLAGVCVCKPSFRGGGCNGKWMDVIMLLVVESQRQQREERPSALQ